MGRLLLLVLSTAIFGASTFLRKLALTHLDPLAFQLWTGTFYAMTVLPLFLVCRARNIALWHPEGVAWAWGMMIVYLTAAICFGYVLRMGNDVGFVAVIAAGVSPIVTMALSMLFMGERIEAKTLVGLGFVSLGLFIALRK